MMNLLSVSITNQPSETGQDPCIFFNLMQNNRDQAVDLDFRINGLPAIIRQIPAMQTATNMLVHSASIPGFEITLGP